MDTFVTIEIVLRNGGREERNSCEHAADRAFHWFQQVESSCTRFDARSEVMQLTQHVGAPVRVSAVVFEAVRFALKVAEETGGAFDPTVGHTLETLGFNREYRTGRAVQTQIDSSQPVSFHDVLLDTERQTITLLRPLILDLGAVAKGLAIDLAAKELRPFANFAIDAGGDLYLGGLDSRAEKWSVGIRHPRRKDDVIDSFRVSNQAVCTSGDYQRRAGAGLHGHIINPKTGELPQLASVTVFAADAMLADTLSTAAFVLGPSEGMRMLDRIGVDGLMISPALEKYETEGINRARPR